MKEKSISKDIVEKEQSLEIKALKDKNNDLEKEIIRLRRTMEEYGIEEESELSDIEYICIQEIKKLKDLSDNIGLTQDDAKTLDLLHKNLRMSRGEIVKKEPKGKKTSAAELLKIVEKKNK